MPAAITGGAVLRPGSSADHLVVQFAQCAVSIPPDRWPLIKALFEQLAELPAPARAAALASSGLGAAEAAELQSLLQHHDQSQGTRGFLADSAAHALVGGAAHTGQRLGAWQIVRPLGTGGMGEVFEAHRADGSYQGRAAVKLLKRGMDSAAVLQRFAQERQALARLSHPHIARLLDAGASTDGLPYFVLEYVDGQPIDLAVHGQPLEARLALFLQLADAVAHAHRNLLVHRDLKPGNVLVDGNGQVKLLDFGIAKALDPLESDGNPGDPDNQATVGGMRPYTPNYASPEQVRGEPVTTATDIYSLGVLLYQMLTGTRPTGQLATTPAEAARSVLEDMPTRPSRVVPNAAHASLSGATSTQAPDPQWLRTRKRLAGDLDNILLKALEKPTAQRYRSVDALAQDVRAFLAGHPVSARAASPAYLARRFIARHRVASTAALLGLAGLTIGLAVALHQMRASDTARALAEKRFQQVRQMAGNLVFSHHDRISRLPGAIEARDALLADALRYLDALLAEGTPDPGLARELAETYQRIAVLQGEQLSPSQERLQEAEQNLDKALALQSRYLQQPDVAPAALHQAADMWLARASQRQRFARLDDTVAALDKARLLAERALARQPGDAQAISRLASVEGRLGTVLGGSSGSANLGRLADALPHLRRTVVLLEPLAQREPANGQWPHELAWAYNLNGLAALLAGQPAQAHAWAEKAVASRDDAARREPTNPHLQYQTAVARVLLAMAHLGEGDVTRSLALQDEAAAIFKRTVATDPGNRSVQRYLHLLQIARARTLVTAGRMAEAQPLVTALVAAMPHADAADFDLQRIRAQGLLWAARAWRGTDAARALAWAQQSAALMRSPATADSNATRRWNLAQALGEQAAALASLGRPAEARAAAQQALVEWQMPPGLFASWLARDRQLAGAL